VGVAKENPDLLIAGAPMIVAAKNVCIKWDIPEPVCMALLMSGQGRA
jgi:hypothetical protein